MSHDAERAVLAAMILDPTVIRHARELLVPMEFHLAAHQKMFQAIVALDDRGDKVDTVTLTEALRRRGELEAVGGVLALTQILDYATTSANFKAHAQIIKESALKRRLHRLGLELQERAIDATLSVADIHAHAISALTTIVGTPSAGPWAVAQSASDFINTAEPDADFIEHRQLARGSLTLWFSPRGLGKTLVAHAYATKQARAGRRVLLLDRDNPRRELRRRLRAWGADGLTGLKIMTRDEAPALTDAAAWRKFPVATYDLVIIDSFDASTEGTGEQDSARTSRALAGLLDVVHTAAGPAFLVLGNTIKSGTHGRGSGVVEDRADIVYEVRDATDLRATGTREWWRELPPADRGSWADRASRRARRDSCRLAFITTKFRVGEEPEPFVLEIRMSEPWVCEDVTPDVMSDGASARERATHEKAAQLDEAVSALSVEISRRAAAGAPMLKDRDAVPFLTDRDLRRSEARRLIEQHDGKEWRLVPTKARGNPMALLPRLGLVSEGGVANGSAAETPDSAGPLQARLPDGPNSADRAAVGGGRTPATKPAPGAASRDRVLPAAVTSEPDSESANGTETVNELLTSFGWERVAEHDERPRPCRICSGCRFSRHRSGGPFLCDRCHPIHPEMIAEQFEVDDAVAVAPPRSAAAPESDPSLFPEAVTPGSRSPESPADERSPACSTPGASLAAPGVQP